MTGFWASCSNAARLDGPAARIASRRHRTGHHATCARRAGSPRWRSTECPGPARFLVFAGVLGPEEPHGWRRPRRRLPRSRPRRRLPPRPRRRRARSPPARRPRSSLPCGRGARRRRPQADKASRLRHGPQRDRPASPRANRPIFLRCDFGSGLPEPDVLPNSPRFAPPLARERGPAPRADWSSSRREVCGTYRGAWSTGTLCAGPAGGAVREQPAVDSRKLSFDSSRGFDKDVISMHRHCPPRRARYVRERRPECRAPRGPMARVSGCEYRRSGGPRRGRKS